MTKTNDGKRQKIKDPNLDISDDSIADDSEDDSDSECDYLANSNVTPAPKKDAVVGGKESSKSFKQSTLLFSPVLKQQKVAHETHNSHSHPFPKKPKLSLETLVVQKEEKAKRAERRTFAHFNESENSGFVINIDRPSGEPAVKIVDSLSLVLKQHQKEGVRFMWNNLFISINKSSKTINSGSGCILAHSMGLGKSLTDNHLIRRIDLSNPIFASIKDPNQSLVVKTEVSGIAASFSPTVSSQDSTVEKNLIHTVLIVAPKNTLQNWVQEFKKWTPIDLLQFTNVRTMDNVTTASVDRLKKLQAWHSGGGVMIVSYEMLRNMTYLDDIQQSTVTPRKASPTSTIPTVTAKKTSSLDEIAEFRKYLINPGPDLVVADEAHVIKDRKSKINKVLNQLRTKRRVALTGTPLQNNLMEYFCMVDWIRHRFLGSVKEFSKRFVIPIKSGESKDATRHDVQCMKKRSHVLHKKLKQIVDRVDVGELTKSLKPLRQFIVVVRMSDFQQFLYKLFLSKLSNKVNPISSRATNFLFAAYQALLRVWNHPFCAVLNHLDELPVKKPATDQSKAAATPKNVARSIKFKTIFKELSPVVTYYQKNSVGLDEHLERSLEGVEDKLLKLKVLKTSSDGSEDLDSDADDMSGDNMFDELEVVQMSSRDSYQIGEDLFIPLSAFRRESSSDTISYIVLGGVKYSHARFFTAVKVQKCDGGTVELAATVLQCCLRLSVEFCRLHLTTSRPSLLELPADFNPQEPDNKSWLQEHVQPVSSTFLQPTSSLNPLSLPVTPLLSTIASDWWKVSVLSNISSTNLDAVDTIDSDLEMKDMLRLGNKVVAFLSLLAVSVAAGEKMILFSQSLQTLSVIEMFLSVEQWGQCLVDSPHTENTVRPELQTCSQWTLGKQYQRIDGNTRTASMPLRN
eukprot:CAMPEP_0170132074 /NCGR_PEP_ID=MMETSP0020_2-20130122/23648_1 /TAXON_ID=98059 /ORGANISM="Dinobryon sp., Strain UTEXLB2267" /LENGTH=909 /DNA_ID=CAMNT_0010367313 /DNA_START=57 /DNA_END=2787 /DNA_ORIENTATION=+